MDLPANPIFERLDPPQHPSLSADELLDSQPWGVLVVDAQHVIRRVNQLAANWCGALPTALLDQPLAAADLPPALRVTLQKLLESGEASAQEVFLPQQAHWISFLATRRGGGWVLYGQDITPQKQCEQQYQALAENTPDVLTRWTPDLRLRYANAAFATKTGQSVSTLLGRTFAEMGAAADITGPYMAALQRVFDTGQPQEHFNAFVGPHGTLYYHSRLVPELREGQIETVLGIARDITALRQSQAESLQLRDELLQHATDKYHTLFQAMDQGFCVLEVLFDEAGSQAIDFRYQELNPVFAQQSGMPADVLGKTARELLPDLDPFWFDTYGQVARTGAPIRVEHYVPQLGRWFDVQVFRVGVPGARQVAVLFRDITARKQAEEALHLAQENHRQELEQQVAARTQELRENRHLLQTVFDASPTAIVVMRILRDAAGRAEDFEILLYNEFNKQVVGRDDLVGQRYSVLFPQTIPTGVLARLLAVVTTGESADFEHWYEGEGMRHWFRQIAVRQDGLLVLTSEVITARKQAEQERTRNLQLLEQAETVAGLGSWDYDLLSKAFLWSDGMYHLFGLPLRQAIAPSIYLDYVVAEDRPVAERLVHCLTTGSACFEETLHLRVDEQVKTVRIKSVVLHNEAGVPVRMLGVDLDISHLQRLEADNLRLRLRQQRALFEAVQAAQETERKRMAESLHNGIGQLLFATKLRLDQLQVPILHTLPALVAARNEANQLLSEAIQQTRALSHELVPLVLEKFGLAQALRDIGRKMSAPHLRFHCEVVFDEDAMLLSSALQLALYRMAQELAQNIVKHALGATEAILELETMPGWVVLRAEDNGAGFAPTSGERPGLGLRSIHDRVTLLGGQLEMGLTLGGGAYVRIRIPLATSPTL
jgi:PAS domain S-box-containing protein